MAGGSVIKAVAESDSDKSYRIRAFTRDAVKWSAEALSKLGVENAVVSPKGEVYKAFAHWFIKSIQLVRNFDVDRGTGEGKLLVNVAKASGVSRIAWSGRRLPTISKISGRKSRLPPRGQSRRNRVPHAGF
ncbi:hypothetical protein DFH07DRAFT_777943 [Mycena maculata]|uniref:NmrA-like domain-containing protein n=1 Tax=Mycena maculata TaxID=230809 RepID=A0AAD7N1M8_9AGAR|nr:hypothetical protein DFH07DRAFT_777943 [Mycena maculata]